MGASSIIIIHYRLHKNRSLSEYVFFPSPEWLCDKKCVSIHRVKVQGLWVYRKYPVGNLVAGDMGSRFYGEDGHGAMDFIHAYCHIHGAFRMESELK